MTLYDSLPPAVPTHFSLFRAGGYRTALISDSHLPMPEFGFGGSVTGEFLGPGTGGIRASLPWEAWARFVDHATDANWIGTPAAIRGAPEISRRALSWIDGGGSAPWCAYLHWLEPHAPYAPASSSVRGRRRVPTPEFSGIVPLDSAPGLPDRDLADLVDNYDDEVRSVDAAFGSLVAELERRGLLDRTIVLFISDHGEEFHEHGGWSHEHSLYDEVLRIPCILRIPGAGDRGTVIRESVRIEDLLPTLLELCGLRTTATMDGRSLGPLIRGEPEPGRPAIGSCRRTGRADRIRSAVMDGWKLVVATRDSRSVEQLFDLRADPGERVVVTSAETARRVALRRLIREAEEVERTARAPDRSTLPPDARHSLEALGYLGHDPDSGK